MLPTIGTILKNGDLAMVGSMNFHRSRRPGKSGRLPLGAELHAHRSLWRRISQQILDKWFVREAEDVVKILRRILGVTPRVGSAEDGHCTVPAMQITYCIGGLR